MTGDPQDMVVVASSWLNQAQCQKGHVQKLVRNQTLDPANPITINVFHLQLCLTPVPLMTKECALGMVPLSDQDVISVSQYTIALQ